MPFTLLIDRTPVNIIEHTRAVTLCSLRVAEVLIREYRGRVLVQRDYLLSGALLHDVGKLFEYERKGNKFVKSQEGMLLRHPISGASFAFKFDVPQEVLHIIAAHSKEGDGVRRTVEAVIVNHADFVNFDVLKVNSNNDESDSTAASVAWEPSKEAKVICSPTTARPESDAEVTSIGNKCLRLKAVSATSIEATWKFDVEPNLSTAV